MQFRGTLAGTVSPRREAEADRQGRKPVSSLEAGRYTFAVTDGSRKAGFTVQEIKQGAITITTTTFTGKRSKTITLRSGQWFFYPTFVGKKTYFIVTS